MIVVSSAFQDILVPGLIVAAIGLFFAVLIVVVSRFFAVEENLRAVGIRELLPGANCGACGYSGCDGYAEALADGEPDITKCPVGGPSLVDDLSELLGITAVAATPTVAHVRVQPPTPRKDSPTAAPSAAAPRMVCFPDPTPVRMVVLVLAIAYTTARMGPSTCWTGSP